MAHVYYLISAAVFALVFGLAFVWPPVLWSLVLLGPLFLVGVRDSLQRRRAVLRNFPLIGNFRYLFELIRPEINQYFIESNTDGTPFSRELRSIVYQRAKQAVQTVPFGTERNLYADGVEWIAHSIAAKSPTDTRPRITIGEGERAYSAAMLNVSAMSFGSLSANAIEALSRGAKAGGFFHNTGEGGISPYHLRGGGDLCWQVGTGYFGCRDANGRFDPEKFRRNASQENVKLIELKLSQGAKPGHGGILPAAKITPEIAAIRGVSGDHDVVSPPAHSAFETPRQLVHFLAELRELSGGKPVGFKLCVGNPVEFVSICKAMVEEGITVDFVTVDGSEGGTGAAPLEFSNSVGLPLTEGLVLVHNALVGFGLRERVKIIAAGKIITGFDMAKRIAAGADLCNSARGMMFSLGCIQARRCHTNACPVGVATQDRHLVRGLVVEEKWARVRNFQRDTVKALMELIGAAGLDHPDELRPHHIQRRISVSEVRHYGEIYRYLASGELLGKKPPEDWAEIVEPADFDSFVLSEIRDDPV